MPNSLKGNTVIITKPVQQSQYLSEQIHALGGVAVPFPTITIAPLDDAIALTNAATLVEQTDFIIFISPNAVAFSMPYLATHFEKWPPHLQWFAVGRTTAKKLQDYNIKNIITPTELYTSEGLLALPLLQQIVGKHIMIITGQGGRELLTDTLQARGAIVHRIDCYQRLLPNDDVTFQIKAWQQAKQAIIIATSSNSLENLCALVDKPCQHLWQQAMLIVSSNRLADKARELGYEGKIITAKSAVDDDIIQALKDGNTNNP